MKVMDDMAALAECMVTTRRGHGAAMPAGGR